MTFYLNKSIQEKAEKISEVSLAQGATKGINSKWFEHIDGEKARAEFAATLRNSSLIRDKLLAVLVKEYEVKLKNRDEDFSSPSWALQQANKVGYMKALENFINLLTITK